MNDRETAAVCGEDVYAEKRSSVTKKRLKAQLGLLVKATRSGSSQAVCEARYDLNQMYEDVVGASKDLANYAERIWYLGEEAVTQYNSRDIQGRERSSIDAIITGLGKDITTRKAEVVRDTVARKRKSRQQVAAGSKGRCYSGKKERKTWDNFRLVSDTMGGPATPRELLRYCIDTEDMNFEAARGVVRAELGFVRASQGAHSAYLAGHPKPKVLDRRMRDYGCVEGGEKKEEPKIRRKRRGELDWESEEDTDLGKMGADTWIAAKRRVGFPWAEIGDGLKEFFSKKHTKSAGYQRWRKNIIDAGGHL